MSDHAPSRVAAMCQGKELFSSPQLARDVAKRRQGRGQQVDAYRCKVCAGWHIGSRLRNNASAVKRASAKWCDA